MQISSEKSLAILQDIQLPGDVTLSEVRQLQTPPISALVRSGDKSECHKMIAGMIVLLNEYFGISWSTYQVMETAKEFYSNYFYWHQLDLKNFFRMCKQMQLAPKLLSVNQFSPIIFAEWAREYDAMWVKTSEEIASLKSDATNYDPDRETKIYQQEVANRVNARTSQSRVEALQDMLDRSQMVIEKLRNGQALSSDKET